MNTALDSRSMANAVTVDAHRRIVVAGATNPPFKGNFGIARYKPNGTLDRSFGTKGLVVTDFGGYDGASAVALDSHDRIVAAGQYTNGGPNHPGFAVARYRSNGSLDDSFGGDGMVTTATGGRATSLATDPQGRIVVAGSTSSDPFGRFPDFAVARYKANGDLDSSFGTAGIATTDFGGAWDTAYSVAIDSMGRVIAAGTAVGDDESVALARYDADGVLDHTFGRNGKVTTRFGGSSSGTSVVLDARGRIVVGGSYPRPKQHGRGFALARYRSTGDLDTSFSGNGKVRTSFGNAIGPVRALIIDNRGRIVAAGGNFDLARYRPNGKLNRSFGKRGKVKTGFGALANAVTLDSRKRILVAGGHNMYTTARFIGSRHR